MQNTPIHTVIFDLGNVLIGWNPRLLYNKVFDDPEQADWFVNNIVTLDWNEEQDRGRPVAEATELLVREHPEWEREIRIYYDRWTEHFSGPIPGNVALLKDPARFGQLSACWGSPTGAPNSSPGPAKTSTFWNSSKTSWCRGKSK
jgi:FMN phosphatase YigB (HAD superfamily)